LKARRKELRNNSTPAERILWSKLQQSNLAGYKFRRQQSIGGYIVDFYCASEKLAIELDGESLCADEALAYDQERTAYLNAHDVRVLRFLNTDLFDHLEAVLARILDVLRRPSLPRYTTPQPPPR
jgi:very-short-patch-repair endonuclease